MNIRQYSSAALAACLSLSSLSATVIYFDDFESYPLGNDQNFSGGGKIYNQIGIADQTTATPFGSPNQYGYLDGGSSFVRVDSSSSLMTWSFDMLEPTTSQTDVVRFGLGSGDVNGTKTFVGWILDDGALSLITNTSQVSGSLPTLQVDRAYTTYLVYNGSGSAQTISGTGATLQDGETALYFYDTVSSSIISAGVFATTGSASPTSFLIRSNTADDNTLYFDNLTRTDTLTVIPEPGAYAAMLGCAVLLGLLRRRSAK
ncbi:hypothetical protein [Cerasicoccus frondis]|uniref:hypothetical protein n=1 Tax=Cerasicoccus frondis TaxID=490090 RepID=UPI0028528724|nr:hypothetical protein [Cerasicoccus frondis]